ncbi:MAG: DUF4476 domain-containing protein [Bacteroidetes bacterium]|nr:DUF4476 domain-containing protein [Bacteroidota bacterium]
MKEAMKKLLITLVLSVFSAAAVFAGHRDSDLKITVHQNQHFILNLDGYRLTRPADQVILRDLEPGRHFLEVFSPSGRHTLYRGYINVQPSSMIKAKIDHRGQFVVSHIIRKGNQNNSFGPVGPGTVIYTGGGVYVPNTGPVIGECGTPPQPFGYYSGGLAAAPAPALMVMHSASFNSLLRSIEAQRFDENRLAMIRDALSRNAFTALQLRDMMYTLDFEANRLQAAKFGYHSLVDPQNIHLVTDAFRFSGSTAELYAYIR